MTRYEVTYKLSEREIEEFNYFPNQPTNQIVMDKFERVIRPKFAPELLEKIREAGGPVVIQVTESVSPVVDGFDRYMELKIAADMEKTRSMVGYLPQTQYVEIPTHKYNILKFPPWLNKLLEYFYPIDFH